MATLNQVVLVGHCGADALMLEETVKHALGAGVKVARANTSKELGRYASPQALMLVNRVPDGRFDAGGGIEIIRALTSQPDPPTVMLISNYPDAQEQAIQAGAQRGFGKADMDDPATVAVLRQAASGRIASSPSASPQ